MIEDEKDRFGETLRLVERAKEDIDFAQRDRELLDKLKAQLRRVENEDRKLQCPKCGGMWESYTFQGLLWSGAGSAAESGWTKESSTRY